MMILLALIIFILLAISGLLLPVLIGSILGMLVTVITGIFYYIGNKDPSVEGAIPLVTMYIMPSAMALGIVISIIVYITIM